jgi:hypothetical protein
MRGTRGGCQEGGEQDAAGGIAEGTIVEDVIEEGGIAGAVEDQIEFVVDI